MNIVNVFKFYTIIFFHEIFLNFLPSFIVKYQRDFCAIEAHVPTQQKNVMIFFMINYFQLQNFKSKGQSSFLFIRLHMDVMHRTLK